MFAIYILLFKFCLAPNLSQSTYNTFLCLGLNLSVKRGELVAVVGPVACGKTTLLMSLIQVIELAFALFCSESEQ